jgi:anthranilate synthase component 2
VILVIDNHDSFTWNLVHYLKELGAAVEVARNDELTPSEALASGADGFLISPGPGTPGGAGISLRLVGACAQARRPLLGVCLGHQAIGQYFGGRVKRAGRLMHGKTCPVEHDGTGLFEGLPSPFTAARYHSLDVAAEGLPGCLRINATAPDASVMGMRHDKLPIHGVQFHPESIASEQGHALLGNFLQITRAGGSGCQIRKARPEDVPRLVQIRAAVVENRLTSPRSVEEADYIRRIAAGGCWVWEERSTILGFSAIDVETSSLWALFVEPRAAGRGIGRALLASAVTHARSQGLEKIWLATSEDTGPSMSTGRGWQRAGRDAAGDLILVCPSDAAPRGLAPPLDSACNVPYTFRIRSERGAGNADAQAT